MSIVFQILMPKCWIRTRTTSCKSICTSKYKLVIIKSKKPLRNYIYLNVNTNSRPFQILYAICFYAFIISLILFL